MKSVPRSVRKRKKTKRLGKIEIVDRERYEGFDVDTKVELIRALIPLGLMNIYTLLDEEVITLAGPDVSEARRAKEVAFPWAVQTDYQKSLWFSDLSCC